jgi:hypothetical protein
MRFLKKSLAISATERGIDLANYQQPDYRVPVTPGVTVQVEGKGGPMMLVYPLPHYTQPTSTKDVPNGYQTPSGK